MSNKSLILKYTLFVIALLMCYSSTAQQNFSNEHFSIEDGLSHNTISNIIQDEKGFIWLATYNGICKYNGYNFHEIKPKAKDSILMKSNRIEKIIDDKFGRIWMNAYSQRAFCYDPKTESFWGTELLEEFANSNFNLSDIVPTPLGRVWLLSELDGCICIKDSTFNSIVFNQSNQNLNAKAVYAVHEEDNGATWLLTDRGLIYIPDINSVQLKQYYFDDPISFYTAISLEDEIWFGGSNGMIVKYSKGAKTFRMQQIDCNSDIILLSKLNKQTVLMVSQNDGFYTQNIFTGKQSDVSKELLPETKMKNLIPIGFSENQLFWFVLNREKGIYQFDFVKNKLYYFPTQSKDDDSNPAQAKALVLTDNQNQVWVQPYGGGFSLYNDATKQLSPLTINEYSRDRKYSNLIRAALFDKQGNLWYNTQSTGIVKLTFSKNNFHTLKTAEIEHRARTKDIRALFQDHTGKIWVASRENRIELFTKNLKKIGNLSVDGRIESNATWPKPAYTITEDHEHNIWIGTRGEGVYKLQPSTNGSHYFVEHFKYDELNLNSLSNNDIYSIFEDKNKQIWIGTFGGGINLVTSNRNGETNFINHRNQLKNYPINTCDRVKKFTQHPSGLLYACTTGGLLVFNPDELLNNKASYKIYEKTHSSNQSVNSNDLFDISLLNDNSIYIATAGGGLNKVDSVDQKGFPVSFTCYGRKEGLPSENIVSIQEDVDGKLWISSENLLTRYDPATEFFEIMSDVKWTLSANNFSEATSVRLKSGELLFGYTEGILHFMPAQIKTNTFSPYLALVNFQLFNNPVAVAADSPLNTAIDECKMLELNNKQNFFNIEYAALDYENTENIKYAYKLVGFDEEWNYVQSQRMANYTNVPTGEYTFIVKSTNSEGIWCNNDRTLDIIILPSFWETPIAYILYFLAFALLIILINFNVLTIYRLKSNVKMEKKMSDMRQKFFIDISHEIRTPLTMITAPVEYLINDNRTPESVKKQLGYISQSTNRMLRLVNQILNFRKIQNDNIYVSEIDMGSFAQNIFNDFNDISKEKNIEYTFVNDAKGTKIWFDENSLEKIIMNLLSNAFKFTPNGKSIILKISKNDKSVLLQVIDQGIGISKEVQKKLFKRFVSFNTDSANPSTGIGLALIKELADKHAAKIIFESELDHGSLFAIEVPLGKKHFGDGVEFVESKLKENELQTNDASIKRTDSEERRTVLIVEDDFELRAFIKNILEDDYYVLEAENGEEGFKNAMNLHPDFIVSDIMMPKMDGIQLLKKLRENVKTSHTPIVLLTAKANIESKLEGLDYGADDYLTKPFSVPYFKARIENIFEQRDRLQQIFNLEPEVKNKEYNPKPYLITSMDEDIMEKVMQTIEENMDNNKLSVDDISQAIGINRTTFFYKIKSLTGCSPNEFIRDVRLKRAAQLIVDSKLLIKEIIYMTGFSDPRYFGKCFKNKYNMTPMEYRNYVKSQ